MTLPVLPGFVVNTHEAYRKGHAVTIHNEDGTATVHYFTQEEGAVMLEPDVRKYFSTSEAVNKALRMLISVIPEKNRNMETAHR